MEYYDEVNALLNDVSNPKKDHAAQKERLIKIFSEESARELFLVVSEWMAIKGRLPFKGFIEICPAFSVMLDRLRSASRLIVQDLVELLYHRVCAFSSEEVSEVYGVFAEGKKEDSPAYYSLFLALVAPEFTKEDADAFLPEFLAGATEISKELHGAFFALPVSYQLAYARCAVFYESVMRGLSLERLALLLMESPISVLEKAGVELATRVTNPTSPKDLIHAIIMKGPYMPTIEAAQSAWKAVETMLDSYSDDLRYHTIRANLEDPELPESSRSALTHRLLNEISQHKSGIFRSPLAGHLVTLVIPGDYIASPVGKIESVLVALNFIRFMLMLDRKTYCFQIMGNQEARKILNDIVDKLEKALKRATESNKRSDEEVLKDLKKINMGQDVELKDIPQLKARTTLSIARLQFILKEVNDLLS